MIYLILFVCLCNVVSIVALHSSVSNIEVKIDQLIKKGGKE